MKAEDPGSGSRLTVQGWLYLVLSVMGVVVLLGALAAAQLLQRTDRVTHELTAQIQPARASAFQLQAALRDQETAVRGYVLAADRQFLSPYHDGRQVEEQAATDIRRWVGNRGVLDEDLSAIQDAAAAWRRAYAEPLIASVVPGSPGLANPETVAAAKGEFDYIRTLFERQNADFTVARDAAVAELQRVRGWRNTVLIVVAVAFFVTAALLAVLVRNAVTRPLDALASACRRITEGDFEQRITPRGPRDIRLIAADVEDMRQRIVDELGAAQSARERLAEQARALDEQAVELRRSNAELEQFAYVASHDLQEPLRKVASFCQLLEKRYADKLDERGVEYIGFAVDGAKRMQALINDLLAFSRVGRLNTSEVEFGLDSALDAALVNLTAALEESHAEIVRPPGGLPRIVGDPTLIAMLWQNLLGNAVKFGSPQAVPQVRITVEPGTADHAGRWLISVSDNGIGIADEFVDKVFVIFQRLHGRDAYAGTGIGLALCKKIVEYHGGIIWVDTGYRGGTRFCFTLPVATAAEPTPIPQESHP